MREIARRYRFASVGPVYARRTGATSIGPVASTGSAKSSDWRHVIGLTFAEWGARDGNAFASYCFASRSWLAAR
jgi:hypothetical protein